MANTLTIRGFACTTIELRNTQGGIVVGNFRMGSTHRKQASGSNEWVDGETNWFRVNVFRSLASNAAPSIHKGDRIIVVGKLNIVSFARKDGSFGTSVEIDAESIGPDLQFGTALYTRAGSQRPSTDSVSATSQGPSFSASPVENENSFSHDVGLNGENHLFANDIAGQGTPWHEGNHGDESESQDDDDDDQDQDQAEQGAPGTDAEHLAVDHETGEMLAMDPF